MTGKPAGKTILWRQGATGKAKVEEFHGFPWGVPKLNERRRLGEYGWGRCSGTETSGSGARTDVLSVSFTLE
jgi:hypothetical protein